MKHLKVQFFSKSAYERETMEFFQNADSSTALEDQSEEELSPQEPIFQEPRA